MHFIQGAFSKKEISLIAKGPGPGPGPAGLTRGPGPGPAQRSPIVAPDYKVHPTTKVSSDDKGFIR